MSHSQGCEIINFRLRRPAPPLSIILAPPSALDPAIYCHLKLFYNSSSTGTGTHRRRMETEAKANCRCCFLGENCRTHGFYSDCVADKFIKGVQGQK